MIPSSSSNSMQVAARNRQIIYVVLILIVFSALWPYNDWLNRIKAQNDLGEATIGQIDTGGFMLKLAMIGGMRGIVANSLWTQARAYEKVHEWDKLKATVEFITKLQPHFLSIWTFQGWNLAYNVSVEWDAPEDKYDWIKQGINFLRDGVAKNSKMKTPDLIWDTAWTYYHKFGMADEAIILRRIFRDDPDDKPGAKFKADPTTGELYNDNFQVARGWFTRAVQKVDNEGSQVNIGGIESRLEKVDPQKQHKGQPGDLAFRTMPAHAQTKYANALEKQSIRDIPATFGGIAKAAWDEADRAWLDFGLHPWPAFRYEDQLVYIEDSLHEDRLDKMTPERKYWTNRWAEQTNYRYWRDRSIAEKSDDAVECRRVFYEGLKAMKTAQYPLAVEKYNEGMKKWDKVLENHKYFRNDDLNRKESRTLVRRFLLALKNIGEKEPETYPFKDLMKGPQEDFTPDPFDQLEMTRAQLPAAPPSPSPK